MCMRIIKIYIKMEEKSQVVEREAKKDEIHEKDGKSKRWANIHSIPTKYLPCNFNWYDWRAFDSIHFEYELWMTGNTVDVT